MRKPERNSSCKPKRGTLFYFYFEIDGRRASWRTLFRGLVPKVKSVKPQWLQQVNAKLEDLKIYPKKKKKIRSWGKLEYTQQTVVRVYHLYFSRFKAENMRSSSLNIRNAPIWKLGPISTSSISIAATPDICWYCMHIFLSFCFLHCFSAPVKHPTILTRKIPHGQPTLSLLKHER